MRIGFVRLLACTPLAWAMLALSAPAADEVQKPIYERFEQAEGDEVPSFQRHVSPLFGRLGCNGRSCHGSFQGRGEFRLSLFGYDFKADHEALLDAKRPRVDVKNIDESLILAKPTDADMHEGGERYKKGSWQHHVLRRWVAAGANYSEKEVQKLVTLEVTPQELLLTKPGQTVQMKAVAVWPDGSKEDVTPLCRFQSNSEQVAKISENGLVTATDTGDTHIVISYDNAVIAIPVIRPVTELSGKAYPKVSAPTAIDKLVVQKLQKLGVVPSGLSNDAEFLRRVSLDLTGTLPSAQEVEEFLADKSPNKRSEKVEKLLESPAYAAWWTTKLCDFTGNNDSQLNNVSPVRTTSPGQEWYDWIYKRVSENKPYDEIAAGIVLGQSRNPGQDYKEYCEELSEMYREGKASFADRSSMPYYWARNNYRQPEERAIGIAYTFLGMRIQCAQCHKHPFDQWSKDDFDAFKAFFARVQFNQAGARDKESLAQYNEIIAASGLNKELKGNDLRRLLPDALKEGKTIPFGEVYLIKPTAAPARKNDKGNANNKNRAPMPVAKARVLGGETMDLNSVEDARQPLMDWMRSPNNPYFAKAFVNRVWASYFNVGIVEPPDDLSLANPPSNRGLLDYLAKGFIEHKFDMKWLHREILASDTYQRSWQPNETNSKDERNFARAVPRRLPAEVAYDAITIATSSDAKAAGARTEIKGRAISIATSSARVQGNQAGNATFGLQVFGRSTRESNCDCDRSMDASLLQTVYLQNDTSVLSALEGGRDTWIDQIKQKPTRLKDGTDPEKVDLSKELPRMKARLDRAKKEKNKEQITRLEARIAELESAAKTKDEVKKQPEGLSLEPITLIRQAYLRTLSRQPTDDEISRCQEFLASSSSPLEGARGLLWTLINTKEFIVNH
ncbi:hypothetical protein ETAA8_29100 [Anatilimnocola aggregata]|uniref:BIG2 domain-containing protein n=1 Tax=Anatilimnocola aggregata TaxID=2528021 RepID=A0A517YCB3_9BACT|nr:DUF1549 and DUF1553 domain-containing protein [Anatilimnocola aggregata]QDU27819.1 hypothetical protein ETAA8_29100 [Anatilimnocola aggregata]